MSGQARPLAEGPARARAALRALRTDGAGLWDEAGLVAVERLLKAAELDQAGAAGDDLITRALRHLEQLRQDFDRSVQRAQGALERLGRGGHPGMPALEEAFAEGRLEVPLRQLRRTPYCEPRLGQRLQESLSEQLQEQARARHISSPGLIEAPPLDRDGRPSQAPAPLEVSESLYRDAVAGATARMTLVRTSAAVPEDAGRYHPMQIGARVLQVAACSPAYLKATLGRLETLGLLWDHGAGRGKRRGKAKKKSGRGKRGVSKS